MPRMPQDSASILVDVVCRLAEPAARAWFLESMGAAGGGSPQTRVGVALAGAGRRLGGKHHDLAADDLAVLARSGLAGVESWPLERCARVALVVRGIEDVPVAEHRAFVDELFRTGDSAEREALLGCLCALPGPKRFQETAVEACRTNVVPVFEAVACENLYPERFFPEPAFNQMVLKAIFLEVAVRRIVGLERRANAELARMASDYASERSAAGRVVPDDIDLVTAFATR
jgi:hypothetical protein